MMFQLFTGGRAKSAVAACAVAVVSLALAAPASRAGVVTVVHQSGTVSATVTDSPDVGGAVVDSNTDSTDAFSRSASADDGAGNSARVTQQVSLSVDDHFEVTGS